MVANVVSPARISLDTVDPGISFGFQRCQLLHYVAIHSFSKDACFYEEVHAYMT